MKLTNINGNTFYIKGGTNTGVYIFDDNTAMIIDPGISSARHKRIINILQENNIKVTYILNTHEHNDHYGDCSVFRECFDDLCIMASEESKLYIEKPELFSNYIVGGKSNKFIENILYNRCSKNIKIDKVVKHGIFNINDTEFNIINFKGHSAGSIGVLTKDKVLFAGDTVIGYDMLKVYNFLFLYDIKSQLDSLNILKQTDYEYLVLGHSKTIISKEDSYSLIDKNENTINKYLKEIREYLNAPIKLDDLLKNIINNNDLKCNYKEYHFFRSSLVSIISYLADLDEIDYILDDGELHYYTKRK